MSGALELVKLDTPPQQFDEAKPGDLIVEEFPITFEGYTYKYGRIAYIKGRGPRPVILVHHNYCGLKQFDVDQACFIARRRVYSTGWWF